MASLIVKFSAQNDAVGVDIPRAVENEITERRRLHRVPPHTRENKEHFYDPVVLSLGPYHHGQLKFPQIDEFKEEIFWHMLDSVGGYKVMDSFRRQIRDKIHDIRNFYREVSENMYDDDVLTEIMVRDTCFVLYCMEIAKGDVDKLYKVRHHLGRSGEIFMWRDLFLLDNQIPLFVINLLMRLKYGDNKGEELLLEFLNCMNFADDRLKLLPWKGDQPQPLHLLEARRAALVEGKSDTIIGGLGSNGGQKKSESNSNVFELISSPFRSVTDLKAKGVHFMPSSYSLKDIKFDSYGTLQLPMLLLTSHTKVLFSNMIAFEMSPESKVDSAVLSYVNFMKSLIQKPEDVKELREKGILSSRLGNDEEVVNIFKEIDAYAVDPNDFLEVKMGINKHCHSKLKTWMAELIHSKFRNPWTAIAFFAAIFLLCLTLIQTYYTINPKSGKLTLSMISYSSADVE